MGFGQIRPQGSEFELSSLVVRKDMRGMVHARTYDPPLSLSLPLSLYLSLSPSRSFPAPLSLPPPPQKKIRLASTAVMAAAHKVTDSVWTRVSGRPSSTTCSRSLTSLLPPLPDSTPPALDRNPLTIARSHSPGEARRRVLTGRLPSSPPPSPGA